VASDWSSTSSSDAFISQCLEAPKKETQKLGAEEWALEIPFKIHCDNDEHMHLRVVRIEPGPRTGRLNFNIYNNKHGIEKKNTVTQTVTQTVAQTVT
jgi:hypothetical protein